MLNKASWIPDHVRHDRMQIRVISVTFVVGLIMFDNDDDNFFCLIYPGFWPIESDDERKRIEKAALSATAKTKVAKVFPVEDSVWASIETFATTPDAVTPLFQRMISALRAAVKTFVEEMGH